MTRRRCKTFTLLEVVICIAVLAMAAVAIGWPMKNMISVHQFHKDTGNFFTDLRRAQLIALSDRVDIELKIAKVKGVYHYTFRTDDPLPHFTSLPRKLSGIKEIKMGQKDLENLELHISPSGRIEPQEEVAFLDARENSVVLDLTTPLCLEMFPKKLQRFKEKKI